MLERFQAEVSSPPGGHCAPCPRRAFVTATDAWLFPLVARQNPGMDFSGATFNGAVPDPKTFMGGVGYK
eukprot:5246411-Prymnesium_polylepis.1